MPAFDALTALNRLYERPGFLLRRAHQISAGVFEDSCSVLGLTPAQFGVMTVLRACPGLDQSRLARALGFDKVTVLRVLRVLEGRALVARTPSSHSRRTLSIALSVAGEQLLIQAEALAESAYEQLLTPLEPPQRQQLIDLLKRLTQGLEPLARAAFQPAEPGDGATALRR